MAKKQRIKDKLIEELAKTPIVQVACEKLGISRQSYYRWRSEDTDFVSKADKALAQGEDMVNDVAESTVIRGVQNRDDMWTKYWLDRRHPKLSTPRYHSRTERDIKPTDDIDAFVQGWLNVEQKTKSKCDCDKKVESV